MATTKAAKAKTGDEGGDSPEFITVKSAQEGRVGLWETDPAHEAAGHTAKKTGLADGEIFVRDEPVKVAKTSRVMERIRDGQLEEVTRGAKAEEE